MKFVPMLLAATLMPLIAQEIKLPASLDKLAAKAEETVDVTLDSSTLRLAARFLSDKDADDAKVKKLLAGLQSITVKSYEFQRDGEYAVADVEAIRSQVKGPGWSRVVGITSKRDGDNVDVYLKDAGSGNLGGVLVLSAGARELTIVSVVGTIDPSQITDLSGHFGVPKLNLALHLGGGK